MQIDYQISILNEPGLENFKITYNERQRRVKVNEVKVQHKICE